jgi:hypothetical protein
MADKYQQEIEEILKQVEEVLPKDSNRSKSSARGSGGGPFGSAGRPLKGFKINLGKLMLASFALLLIVLTVGTLGIGNLTIFLIAGLVMFVIAYFLLFVGSSGISPGYEKRWRGRLIEENPSAWERFKRWLRG